MSTYLVSLKKGNKVLQTLELDSSDENKWKLNSILDPNEVYFSGTDLDTFSVSVKRLNSSAYNTDDELEGNLQIEEID